MSEKTTVPVIVLKHKNKEGRYLADGIVNADFNDPDGDLTLEDIENAFIIVRKDRTTPGQKEIDDVVAQSEFHKKYMLEMHGPDALISFDVKAWLENYEPVNIDIPADKFNIAAEYNGWEYVGGGANG